MELIAICVAVCCSVSRTDLCSQDTKRSAMELIAICVAVCCSVLQFVAVNIKYFSKVLQCVAECRSVSQCVAVCRSVLQCVAVCCSVLQCHTNGVTTRGAHFVTALHYRVWQCVAVCCSVLQCVAVCCSVLQCIAVSYQWRRHARHPLCCGFAGIYGLHALPFSLRLL